MGSKVARRLYEQARSGDDGRRARKAVLDSFAAATDNWTRSALIAAATEQAPAYVIEALDARASAGADRLRRGASCPRRLPAHAEPLARRRRPQPGPRRGAAQGQRRPGDCADGRWHARPLDAATTQALQKLLDDPATRAAALCRSSAKWDTAGALRTLKADSSRAARCCSELGRRRRASDDRRVESAGEPARGAGPPRARRSPRSPRCCPTRRCRAAVREPA